jgi:hypothetical protein
MGRCPIMAFVSAAGVCEREALFCLLCLTPHTHTHTHTHTHMLSVIAKKSARVVDLERQILALREQLKSNERNRMVQGSPHLPMACHQMSPVVRAHCRCLFVSKRICVSPLRLHIRTRSQMNRRATVHSSARLKSSGSRYIPARRPRAIQVHSTSSSLKVQQSEKVSRNGVP